MIRRGLFALFVLAACSEAGAPQPTASPAAAARAQAQPSATVPRVGTLRVAGGALELDGRALVKLRPASAPGVVGSDLASTYVYDELRTAFAQSLPIGLELAKDTPVAVLRGVLASLPKDTAIAIGEQSVRTGATAGLVRIRFRRDAVELRDADTTIASVDKPARAPELVAKIDAARRGQGVVIDAPDDLAASELAPVMRALGDTPLVLAIEHAPCVTPPPGMACVPGGPAIVGSDDGPPEERPRRELELSTFYIDQHEITISDYDKCHADRACAVRINGYQKIMQPFVGPNQPVVPMDWERAMHYCAWRGKRLPSEWEWEKAARGPDGDIYPWGNDAPTCDKAQYRECAPVGCKPYPGKAHRWDCNEHDTKNVGTFPAGHYGLFEMAGNGYEWTHSGGVEDIATCGAACNGKDPLGPCDGAWPCITTRRILRGGSWYWPMGRIRGSHRRIEMPKTGSHRLSARCASTTPWLTDAPARVLVDPRPEIAEPEPPSAEELQHFAAIEQDPIEDKPICSEEIRKTWGVQARGGRSDLKCRDPFPYLESNEPRAYLWAPYLKNIGGAYLGIASDQNYSFIAVARSQWAWVMDYDPRVTDHHQRVRAFVLEAETPEDFVAMWKDTARGVAALEKVHAGSAALGKLKRGYLHTHERLHEYFIKQREPISKAPGYGWLANPEHYAYIRKLFQQGRIMPIKGDLLGSKSMHSVAEAAKALGVPIRVYYTSNAPSSWGGTITDSYRKNVVELPFDSETIVLQTFPKGAFRQTGHWHHNVAQGELVQRRMRLPGFGWVTTIIFDRIPTAHGDLTASGLPAPMK